MKRKGSLSLKASILLDVARSITNAEAAEFLDVLEEKRRKHKHAVAWQRQKEWYQKKKDAEQLTLQALKHNDAGGWAWLENIRVLGQSRGAYCQGFRIMLKCTSCTAECAEIGALKAHVDQTGKVIQLSLDDARTRHFNESDCVVPFLRDGILLRPAEIRALLPALEHMKPVLPEITNMWAENKYVPKPE